MLLQVLKLLETRKTEIPRAYALTELITYESQQHRRALTATIEAHLSPMHRAWLDALLDKQESLWQPEPHVQRYKLTLLKRFSQSTKPAKIRANIEDLRILRPLYQEMEAVAEALDLTPEGVRYYANAVLKSQIFQVARRADDNRHLHLVCFIIHQFLRAIRPTSPQFVSADINEILEESVSFLRTEIRDRDILVEMDLAPDLPKAEVDRDQLKQAFYNVIKNAFQAMRTGGILHIRSWWDDAYVSVAFTDTGSGISPEDMSKLFRPYFTTKSSGSGLGLLIVRRIVREHGGEIEIESNEGRGIRVTVHLPHGDKRIRLLEAGDRRPETEENG